jgi:MFS family permease
MQGLGGGLMLPMIFAIPSQWFRKYRGVATGIVIAGFFPQECSPVPSHTGKQ